MRYLTTIAVSLVIGFATCIAEDKAKEKGKEKEDPPKFGLQVGNKPPFIVVDFVAGEHVGGGCPFVIISNRQKPGLVILARDEAAGSAAFDLASKLDGTTIDGDKHLGYVAIFGTNKDRVAELAKKAHLTKINVGIPRRGADQTLESYGVDKDAELMIVLVDGKTIKKAWAVSGKLSKEAIEKLVVEFDRAVQGEGKK